VVGARARLAWAGVAAALAAGCTIAPPVADAPRLPQGWSAPLPHGGTLADLGAWWSQFDDPLLVELIESAQRENGTVATAAARIAETRAALRGAGASNWPQVGANANLRRSEAVAGVPFSKMTTTSIGLDSSWEIDLFGYTRNRMAAAGARADAAMSGWHDARVSLAAEVAATYAGLRACESLVQVYEQDSASQTKTAELTRLKVEAGFESPANGALADAGAADAAGRRDAQRAECALQVKALVALTAFDEPALRSRLAATMAKLAQPGGFAVAPVPAQWVAQRPDLVALERELAAAAADVGAAQANLYPRLSITGTIAASSIRFGGGTTRGTDWSIAPSLFAPLFDGGRRASEVDAARARFDAARAAYVQRVRDAVREVEEALVRLDSATLREADAKRAARGYRAHFDAAQSRWDIGVGSLLDLEDARRLALAAEAGVINLRRERVAAWIALYKAVGGGWRDERIGAEQIAKTPEFGNGQ
jgi:multidrug efflux system outer membrane protein